MIASVLNWIPSLKAHVVADVPAGIDACESWREIDCDGNRASRCDLRLMTIELIRLRGERDALANRLLTVEKNRGSA